MLTTPPKRNCGLGIISKNSIVVAHSGNDFIWKGKNKNRVCIKRWTIYFLTGKMKMKLLFRIAVIFILYIKK